VWSFPCTRRFRSRGVHFLVTALQSMSFCMSKGWAWMRLGSLLFSRSCRYKCSLNLTQQQQLLHYGNCVLALLNCLPFTFANVFCSFMKEEKGCGSSCFWTITATFPLWTSCSPAVFTVGQRIFQISHNRPVFFSGEKMTKGDTVSENEIFCYKFPFFLGNYCLKVTENCFSGVRCNQSTLVYKSIPMNL